MKAEQADVAAAGAEELPEWEKFNQARRQQYKGQYSCTALLSFGCAALHTLA